MDIAYIEEIAGASVIFVIAWLGWPVAKRIREAAMIDVAGEISALRGNCEALVEFYRKLETRVTLLEGRSRDETA